MHDVLENIPNKTIKCLDKGHVTIMDTMPRLVPDDRKTADYAIVQAARVSYGDGTKTVNEDRGLIRYLMRHKHTTPMEMIEFKFCMKMPIFVARQMIRHRAASVNEYSGRYSIMRDEFYMPEAENVRAQSKTNRQGGEEPMRNSDAVGFLSDLESICSKSYQNYESSMACGISREQARMLLPVNLYTEWYWKIDAHNLLHFLALRCDSHAQMEIRVFADAILELIKPIIPLTIEAWEDYSEHRGARKITRLELDAIKSSLEGSMVDKINSDNSREQAEWAEKAKIMGLQVRK